MGLRELSPLTASPRKEGYTPPQHAPPSKKMLTFCSCGREKVRIFLVHFGNFFPSCACMCAHTHTFSLRMLTHPLTEKETAILPRGSVFPHHGPPSSSPSQAVCPPHPPSPPVLVWEVCSREGDTKLELQSHQPPPLTQGIFRLCSGLGAGGLAGFAE